MSEFTIRSESVDVEQIMKQIRARILEKRGADYTEDQIRELASVRLEKFLDPKNLRSDLLEQFRKSRPAAEPLLVEPLLVEPLLVEPPKIEPPYVFDDQTLFTSHRGPIRFARKLLRPLLKLFFNPNTLNQILHVQAQFNVDLLKREARRRIENQQFNVDLLKRDARRRIESQQQEAAFAQSRAEWNMLYYEVLHNLVLETTRMGIESQNLRMRVESLSSRLDFSERRVRALEGVVQYRPEVIHAPARREPDHDEPAAAPAMSGSLEGFVPTGPHAPAQGPGPGDANRKRRRRRRGRRGGTGEAGQADAAGQAGVTGQPGGAGEAGGGLDEGDDADGFDGGDDMPGGGDDSGHGDMGGSNQTTNPGDEPNGGSSDDNGEQ